MPVATISKQTLFEFLFTCGISEAVACVEMADPLYALPTRSWLVKDFAPAFRAFYNQLQSGYSDADNDCDDFARAASFFAHVLHYLTPGHPFKTALAFGEFWYQRDAGGGHAINVAVVWEDAGYHLVFLEPQTGQLLALTTTEIQSCASFRF